MINGASNIIDKLTGEVYRLKHILIKRYHFIISVDRHEDWLRCRHLIPRHVHHDSVRAQYDVNQNGLCWSEQGHYPEHEAVGWEFV